MASLNTFYSNLYGKNRRSSSEPGVWETILGSDIQPMNAAQIAWVRAFYKRLKDFHPAADEYFCLGDLVHRGVYEAGDVFAPADQYNFPEFIADVRGFMPLSRVFTIAGNHDRNYSDGVEGPINTFTAYLKNFPRNTYYTLRGNILSIFMGTIYPDTAGAIYISTLEWAKDLIRRHRDCFIQIITHHPPPNVGLHGDATRSNNLGENGTALLNFINEVGNEVDLWMTGHITGLGGGGNGLLDPGTVANIYVNKCWHVNVGLHVPNYADAGRYGDISYCRIKYTAGSPLVVFERINATTGVVSAAKSFTIKARVPIRLTSELIHDGRRDYDERTGLMESRQKIITTIPSSYSTPGGVPTWTPIATEGEARDLLGLYMIDAGQDVAGALGPSIGLYVPGAGAGDTVNDKPWGFGARVSAVRTSDADANYSTELRLYSSGSGKEDNSGLMVAALTSTGYFYAGNRIGVRTRTPDGLITLTGDNGGGPSLLMENSSQDIAVPTGQLVNFGRWNASTQEFSQVQTI